MQRFKTYFVQGIVKRLTSVVCLVLTMLATHGPLATSAPGRSTSSASHPLPAHKDAEFTEIFRQTNGWNAGDGAISVALSDERILWLFGDSYVDQFDPATGTVPCLFSARNAALVQSMADPKHPQTLRNTNTDGKTFFKPPDSQKDKPWPCFWPGAGFQSGDIIYVYEMEMDQTPSGGTFGFKNIGQSFAKLSFPSLTIRGYTRLPDMNGINFWCGFINEKKSGLTYAFGNKQTKLTSDVYVARFPTKNPEGTWLFWDGKKWSTNAGHAAIVGQGASYSVGVSKVGERFVLLSSAFSVACDQGRDIYMSVADRPTGPFSTRKKIFAVADTVQGHFPFFYSVFAHSEFINAKQELLITYSINGYEPCVPNCVNGRMNPDYYRPRAIRLPLSEIAP